jgi:hypothetical protein
LFWKLQWGRGACRHIQHGDCVSPLSSFEKGKLPISDVLMLGSQHKHYIFWQQRLECYLIGKSCDIVVWHENIVLLIIYVIFVCISQEFQTCLWAHCWHLTSLVLVRHQIQNMPLTFVTQLWCGWMILNMTNSIDAGLTLWWSCFVRLSPGCCAVLGGTCTTWWVCFWSRGGARLTLVINCWMLSFVFLCLHNMVVD